MFRHSVEVPEPEDMFPNPDHPIDAVSQIVYVVSDDFKGGKKVLPSVVAGALKTKRAMYESDLSIDALD